MSSRFLFVFNTLAQMVQQPKFFRPQWTCGRYNASANTAIMYNLLIGESFYFESTSARFIHEIISVPRGGKIDIERLQSHIGISQESIIGFMQTLLDCGLVCTKSFSKEEIRMMQRKQGDIVTQMEHNNHRFTETPNGPTDSAEMEYAKSLDLSNCISSAMLELTYNCSEKCIHCYNAGATRNDCEVSTRNREELNIDDYKRIIDELYDLGTYKVCLTGGDPFSKPIVWDIIDYLYQKDIAFDIYTNGQSITKNVDKLIDYFPRSIGLSIYSADSDVHDRITRIKGSLSKTLNVAEQLSGYGVPLFFKCVVFKLNIKSYHTVKELANRYGAVLQIETNLCNGVDGDMSIVRHLRLPADVLEVLFRDADTPLYVDERRDNYGATQKPLKAGPCRAGEGVFNITPDGMVTPCCSFPLPLGSVRTDTLKNILQDKPLQTWRQTNIEDIEECGRHAKCEFCYLCCGNNYTEHNTPLKPSRTNCFMAEVRYNLMQKLKVGDDPLRGLSVEKRLQQMEIEEVGVFGKEITQKH